MNEHETVGARNLILARAPDLGRAPGRPLAQRRKQIKSNNWPPIMCMYADLKFDG